MSLPIVTSYDAILDFPGGSKLSQRFGKETLNYYAGSPLNRLSFLRSKTPFLRAALPHAKFLLLKNLNALSSPDPTHLAFLAYQDVKSVVGTAYDLDEDKLIAAYDSSLSEEGAPIILFLGVDEDYVLEKERGEGEVAEPERFAYEGYRGRPYFAVDLTTKRVEEAIGMKLEENGRIFQRNVELVPKEAAMLAQARSLMDWNMRHQFCSACGGRTISTHAGTKRTCPPTDRAGLPNSTGPPKERPPCVSRKGIHNIAFPRTDPTVIMAIVNSKGDKVLVGRKASWPANFYSTLAGFCETAESIEDAVRRETWEESGVRVGRVVIHSSQPWPYPSNLMIGCIGEALPGGEEIHLGHDPELNDALWVPIPDLRYALTHNSSSLTGPPPKDYKEGDIRFPPATAIAHQLLLAVANNYHLPPKM